MDSAHAERAAKRHTNKVCEPIMTKPSERIVVFVTPAQKRAIAATADELGISVSELVRRAVLSFDATSEQVKAASIVDQASMRRAHPTRSTPRCGASRRTRSMRAALPPLAHCARSSEASGLANADANHALARCGEPRGA